MCKVGGWGVLLSFRWEAGGETLHYTICPWDCWRSAHTRLRSDKAERLSHDTNMTKMIWFQLLKCECLLFFSVFYDCKLSAFGILDCLKPFQIGVWGNVTAIFHWWFFWSSDKIHKDLWDYLFPFQVNSFWRLAGVQKLCWYCDILWGKRLIEKIIGRWIDNENLVQLLVSDHNFPQ